MRKLLLLGAAALMVPTVAFADGEAPPAYVGWYFAVGAGWTDMEMPEHGNAAPRVFDLGGGFAPLALQTDVDGVSYNFGAARDFESGWRWGIGMRFFDGDGSASQAVVIPGGTPFRYGNISGTTLGTGAVVALAGTQTLDVDATQYAIGTSIGRSFGGMLRGDIVVSYDDMTTSYVNVVDVVGAVRDVGTSRTRFSTDTIEFAARLSANIGLMDAVSLGLGGSAGWGLRNIDMKASQTTIFNNVLITSTSLNENQNMDAFIGRLDASLNYAVSPGTMIGLTANYVYDDSVPTYVPPSYPAAGTGTAATFVTESQTTMTYGLRLIGRF